MLQGRIFKMTIFLLAAIFLFGACRKREGFSLPDNYIVYTTDAQGISEAENSIVVKLKLTRGTDKEIPVTVNITEQGLQYGTKYTTTPAATNGTINLTVPSGNNEASFTVNKVAGALFEGIEKLVFDIHSSGTPILIGNAKQLTLSFAELVATNSAYTINGGGVTYPNKVFIDLSANRQTAVQRTNWDLGFYSGDANDFTVTLNATTAMMVKKIDKNDLTQVTATDTIGFGADVAYSPFAPSPAQLEYVDYPDGSLNKTAIGVIAVNAADNKVFIVNRGSGVGTPAPARGWKKIRVLRNANGGYTLQHADIGSATFSSIDIPKDDKYFFKYVSFENGIVPVEPEKTKWDIAWTYTGYVANFGAEVPYTFQDIVIQNRNVEIAKVSASILQTPLIPFENFTEANLSLVTFSGKQATIGSDWRRTTPSPAQVWDDRYYIIKDGNNNYYKLRFTALTENGNRGFPAIEYVLIKRG